MTPDPRRQILEDAADIVTGGRAQVYGGPEDNFARIAALQEVYLTLVLEARASALEPHDIAILNILQKVARLVQSPAHRDSWLDIAGYAACGYVCADQEGES